SSGSVQSVTGAYEAGRRTLPHACTAMISASRRSASLAAQRSAAIVRGVASSSQARPSPQRGLVPWAPQSIPPVGTNRDAGHVGKRTTVLFLLRYVTCREEVGMDGDPAYGHIVVGVDGSPTSRAALRWAAREAELRRCALDVVYGWQVKGEPRPPGEWGGVAPPIEAYQQQARARTQGVVDEVLPN